MRPLQLGLALALGLSSFAIAQTLPPMKKSEPSNRQSVRVRGCIKGQTLVETEGSLAPAGTIHRLRGSRSIVASLKEHDGHDDELVGTMQIGDEKKYKATKEKQSGKNRVYVSASAETKDPQSFDPPEDFPIEVDSIKHLSDRCPGAGRP